jgi:acyl transferase domain-containing protein
VSKAEKLSPPIVWHGPSKGLYRRSAVPSVPLSLIDYGKAISAKRALVSTKILKVKEDIIMTDDAVIVGVACQLPGDVDSPERFWEFCRESRCSTGTIPRSRFNSTQFYHPDRSKKGHFHVEGGSFLAQDPGVFDAPFFHIGEAEAKALDPQQRLLLQTTFLALENAGIALEWLSGRHDVGVFTAGSPSEYHSRFNHDPYTAPAHAGMGVGVTMNSNRISYFLNLKGPSITLDTACSSALSALHLAVESIRRGESTCAIVGASCLQLSPHTLSQYSSLGYVTPRSAGTRH